MSSQKRTSASEAVAQDLGPVTAGWSVGVYAPILLLSAITTLPYYTITSMYINERLLTEAGHSGLINGSYQDTSTCRPSHRNTSWFTNLTTADYLTEDSTLYTTALYPSFHSNYSLDYINSVEKFTSIVLSYKANDNLNTVPKTVENVNIASGGNRHISGYKTPMTNTHDDESEQNSMFYLSESTSDDDIVDEVSRQTSRYAMLLSVAKDIPALFTVCLLGAISDIRGRKIPIIISGITSVVRLGCFMITAKLELPLYYLLIGEFINGIGANHCTCVLMMSSAHISDAADTKNKGRNMLLADLVFFAGSLGSDLATGFLLPYVDYFYVVGMMLIFQVVIIVYTIVCIPNFTKVPDKKETVISTVKQTLTGTIKVFFTHKETNLILIRIWAIVVVIILHQIVYLGIYNTLLVLVLSPPLCWRSILLGLYNAAHDVTFLLAGLGLGTLRLLPDTQLLAGLTSSFAFCIGVGLGATSTWAIWFAMICGSLRVLVTPACRTMMSDLVPDSQLGSAMAGIMSTWFLCDLIGNVLFSHVYTATITVYSGAAFLVAGAFYVLALPISGWLLWLRRRLNGSGGTDIEDIVTIVDNSDCINDVI